MKIEKIDIVKTLIDMPDGRDRMDFVTREPLKAFTIPEGEVIPEMMISATRKTYLVQKCTYEKDPPKAYLVAVDEKETFNDLLKITDNLLNRAVERKTDFWKDTITEELIYQKHRIKMLPWHKRLFNKF